MGGSESGTLVDKQFCTLANQKNFLANMEQVNPASAYSIADKLKSKSGSVSRFVLMTKGKVGKVSSWQTKHLFVCSWVIENIPFEQYKFIRHTYQNVEFISLNLDACAFNYMTYFMDTTMFFLSKDEFVNRIVELCNDSDPLINQYISSPYDEPRIEKPIYATATPSFYTVPEVSSVQSKLVTREQQNAEEMSLSSSVREMDSESSKSLPHPYIPELEDLNFSETESSFIAPISEYSSRDSTSASSSLAGPISESGIESDVSGAFVNGSHYKSHQSRTSTMSSASKSSKIPPISSAYSRSSKNSRSSAADFQISEDSATMDGTMTQSESESSRRRRHKSRNVEANTQGSNTRQSKADGDELNFSDGPSPRRQKTVNDENDSIVFEQPDSLNESSSSSHSQHRSHRGGGQPASQGSKQSSGSKRNPVNLPAPDQIDDGLILSTHSTASRASRRQSSRPRRQDAAGDEELSVDSSSRSSNAARRKRYGGSTNDSKQVPMSSDTGLADQESKDVSSKEFLRGSRSSRSSHVSSHTGDTNPIPGAFESKPTGQLRSGNTNVRSKDFGNYMGTGTSTSSGHRAIHNDATNNSSISNAESKTDSRMKTNSSDFDTGKFQPFNKEKKEEPIETSDSFSTGNKSSSKRFAPPPVEYDDDDYSSDI